MDDGLPLASLSATTLRILLAQERVKQTELEQEVARLAAGLARQNARIVQLERENAELRRMVAEQQQVIAGLQEQNALLRQQVAELEQENARLREDTPKPPHQPAPWPSERTKAEGPRQKRRKRDPKHNRGRQRTGAVDEVVEYAAEACPRCGSQLSGGWVHRRLQVIDLPVPCRALMREHVLIAR
jgi:uncharacterized coiled-coil protein SlyX